MRSLEPVRHRRHGRGWWHRLLIRKATRDRRELDKALQRKVTR